MSKPDYYELLGLEPEATERQIATAYRGMALKLHPDKNPEDPVAAAAKFLQIKEAYQILSDPEAKAAYDKVIATRRAHRLREQMMDGRRREMRQDLREREAEAEAARRRRAEEEEQAEILLARQMERLRRQARETTVKEPTILRVTSLSGAPLLPPIGATLTKHQADADLSKRFAQILGIPVDQIESVSLAANRSSAKLSIYDDHLARSIIEGGQLPLANDWIIERITRPIITNPSEPTTVRPFRPPNYEEQTLERLLTIAKDRNSK